MNQMLKPSETKIYNMIKKLSVLKTEFRGFLKWYGIEGFLWVIVVIVGSYLIIFGRR